MTSKVVIGRRSIMQARGLYPLLFVWPLLVGTSASGALDLSFSPPILQGDVRAILVQPEGKILVGGGFTLGGQQPVRGIILLNSDGTIDTNFNVGTGIEGTDSYVAALARQADGKILVGGKFS